MLWVNISVFIILCMIEDIYIVTIPLYCHVLSDYRRVLDCQLDLLGLNTVPVYYTSQLSLPGLSQQQLTTLSSSQLMASLAITSSSLHW
jgi:hypothetical protein